ncbi:unnamed protein product [Arabis nemorensis]|uniref:O-acyltransferase WSD1 C-terminal domain-containing protein n=1 Tax=Arabis nemorensis TaxID=586526 RepID=A0A565AL39_9BRAS|nr:unnamed protein product [Arabis nemorensis]
MTVEKQMTAGEKPLSPFSRLFSLPGRDCFNIITIGSKNECNPIVIVEGLKNTLINHPRFSSILDTGNGEHKGKAKWVRTQVNVEEHVIIPEIDPNIENPDQFLEDYTSSMAVTPMDKSKPLWEFHLLKMKTSHHSLGDGMSLMSLLLACTRKTCDPEAFSTFVVASTKRSASATINTCWFWSMVAWFWYIVRVIFHTCVGVFKSMVMACFGGDTSSLLMGKSGATLCPNKFIHRIISLEDVKFVLNAMNADLAKMMAKGSKFRWGNSMGYVTFPLWMKSENDILEYIRRAKATMDRKKLSLEPLFSYALLKFIMEVFGIKALNIFMKRIFGRSTMVFSNVIGPTEEISYFDHQISYIAATSIGLPQVLTVNIQSYVNKVIFNLGVDLVVISDPHHLCDLIFEALRMMKTVAAENTCCDSYA